MANKTIFRTRNGRAKAADTRNSAGGKAYKMSDKLALAQFAMTGTLNNTYYNTGKDQFEKVMALAAKVDDEFIAKLAVYSRTEGFMKDMPALLLAILASRNTALLKQVFDRVVDNGKMLRNFVQIVRSGVTGRRSLGNAPKRLVQKWLAGRSDFQVFRDSVGQDPSLADIIKMVHPKATSAERNALYGYLIGKVHDKDALPKIVKDYEAFKKDKSLEVPKVPFQMLTALDLDTSHWKAIADNAKWMMTRMNLRTFQRHGVFDDKVMVNKIADRLRNPDEIKSSKAFPYQILTAYTNAGDDVPTKIKNALQDALEVSVENVPLYEGDVFVGVDTSGSMGCPITGWGNGRNSSATRCVEVAGLFASSILRKNEEAVVIPFDTRIHNVSLNSRDSVMTNAQTLASFGGGDTDVAAPLRKINAERAHVDLYVLVSDNEGWYEPNGSRNYYYRGTSVAEEWKKVLKRCPKAKMVNINIVASDTTQIYDDHNVLNIGSFSDNIWKVIDDFINDRYGASAWVQCIEQVDI